jgi:hypothetical protein
LMTRATFMTADATRHRKRVSWISVCDGYRVNAQNKAERGTTPGYG